MGQTVFRSRGQSWGLRLWGITLFGVLVGVGIEQRESALALGASLGIGIGILVLFLRAGQSARFEDGHVTIVNPIRRRAIEASEIERFILRPRGLSSGMAHALLKDGELVPIWGIQAHNPLLRPAPLRALALIEHLHDLLATAAKRTCS